MHAQYLCCADLRRPEISLNDANDDDAVPIFQHAPDARLMAGAPVDFNVLAQLLGQDADSIHKFALVFLNTTRDGVQELEAALASGNVRRMRELGHKMKSSAYIVGAPGMAALCESLEHLPPGVTRHDAAPLVAQLSSLLEQASRQILQQRS